MLAKFYGWTFETIDNMSFEQIESAIACMPVEHEDGSVRPERRQRGISVDSMEQVEEINAHWREYFRV